ncbi:MAG: outer membrane protein transport protein [Thiobacillus sp.]|nr:outer membrane protein transport protein [Thiobacillus sp.]
MMFKRMSAMVLAFGGMAGHAYATNGMNVEGFGPIATSMGGASMAYDNGAAAMMNNPATLGLGADGDAMSLMIGYLGPDVKVVGGQSSGGDAYYMPAAGWTRKRGDLTYGVGMFAQGGMGTEYAMGLDGLPERSELGVGRLIAPLVYNVDSRLTIGGSVDFVWAMLDLQMAMPFGDGTYGMSSLITVPPTGALGGALGGLNPADIVRINYSDDSDYSGKAKSYGWAGKIGFTYKINDQVNVGGTYHSKTSLSDMETGSVGAQFMVNGGVQTVDGKITVRDFQWPETYGLGVAVQASPEWMLVADWKRINWRDVMKNFTMTYSAMGDSMTFALPQNWENQDVLQLGLAYKATAALTLRTGASFSDNPVPDSTLNYLFPAIEKNHYMAGFGYAVNDSSSVDFSLQHAPKVEQTNSMFGYTVSHAQTSWQLLYSKRF